jgi:predicted transcriptional regulator
VQKKSLSAQQNELARKELRALIKRLYSSQKEASKSFGVTQAMVSDFLAGKRGAGPKLIMGVATVDKGVAATMLGIDTSVSISEPVATAIASLIKVGVPAALATHAAQMAATLVPKDCSRSTLIEFAMNLSAVAQALARQVR